MRSEATGLAAEAALFHALSDPSRLLIVRHLSLGEHRVVDLTAHLGLAQSTVSKHLACLKDSAWWPRAPRAGRRCGR